MFDIIGKKRIFFLLSGLLIIPGTFSLIFWGLKPSIDFTGGTLMEVQSASWRTKDQNSGDDIKKILTDNKIELSSMTKSADMAFLLRLKHIEKWLIA